MTEDLTSTGRVGRNVIAGLSVAVWALVIALGRAWGLLLEGEGRNLVLFTPPVLGGYRASLPDHYVLAVGAAAALVLVLPRIAARQAWWVVVGATVVGSAGWWAILAMLDGSGGFTRGLEWEREWAPAMADAAQDPGGFLRGFVEQLPTSTIQVRGHPPGLPLLGAVFETLGIGTEGGFATITFVAGLSAVVAVLLTVRSVVDERAARRVAPFLVLTPAALWLVMSFDTLYAAVTAWFVFVMVSALRATGRRAAGLAMLAGALAFAAAMLSYGMVLVGFVVLFVAVLTRRWWPLVVAAATALTLTLALVPLGFWWFSGLGATQHEYHTLDLDRPYSFFLIGNMAAWGLAVGPAVVVGFALLRDRRGWALAGGGLAAAVAANLSGLSEGEVERIWLPFTLWASVATMSLDPKRWLGRVLLGGQAVTALALTATIRTYW